MATPDEILASIDELNGHIDNQLKHFAPQLEALKAVRHSEAARTEGLQLEMEQRRLARGQAAPHSIPQAIQMQRQQLRAQLRALEQPGDGAEATAATEGEKEEGAQLLQSAASPRTLKEEEHLAVARLEAAAVELSMYNPNAGIQEQVDQAQRIVDGVLNALQQDLAFTEAQHIEQMLELRRQVERSRGLYQEELQALKKAIADQEKQTQSQVDFLETAKTKCTEAVQERKAAALKTTYRPQSPAEEDGEEVMASPRDGAAGALPAQSSATGSTPTSNNSQPSFASAPAPAPASTPAAPAAPASAAPGPEDDKASVKSDASSGTASSTSTPTPTTSRVQSTPGTKSKPTGLSRPGSMVRPSTTPRTRTTKTMPVTTPRKVGAAVKS